jgi:hypothetical protein
MRMLRRALTIGVVLAAGSVAAAQNPPPTQQPPPVPRPFPGAPTPPPPTSKPAETAAAPHGTATAPPVRTPTQADLGGAPVYPTAEFLDSFDAGRGQRLLIYGVNMPYADIITYYRAQLRSAANRELMREPPMYQFDLGRFDEKTMNYPPTLVIKDHTWNGSEGYLQVNGTTEKRYKTIIQIIPSTGGN